MNNLGPRPMYQKKSKTWLVIVIIIALAVLAYLAYSFRNTLIPSGTESTIGQLESQGASDEVSAIEQDLTGTTLQGLDSEVADIEKELESSGL